MRICSLLPSTTEICFALGLSDEIVCVTHECDYPSEALKKPRVTRSAIPSDIPGAEIDRLVRSQLSGAGTLYHLDTELLARLAPDVILTQELCTVCSISYETVLRIAQNLPSLPQVVNIEPRSLEGILESILAVGRIAGVVGKAESLAASLRDRIERVRALAAPQEPKRVVCLEWVDPPFCGGHWIPELVTIAGGIDALGRLHEPSKPVAWNQIIEYNPDVIVVMCCGFTVERGMAEWLSRGRPFLQQSGARIRPRVAVVDGSSFFSRPGPRIAESVELLASIIHPDLFPYEYPESVLHVADQ